MCTEMTQHRSGIQTVLYNIYDYEYKEHHEEYHNHVTMKHGSIKQQENRK